MTGGHQGFLEDFVRLAREQPDRLYATFDGRKISYGELYTRALCVGAGLRRRGLMAGDHVCVMLRNSPDALAAIIGLGLSGMVWVPVNAQARGPSLRHVLEHSDPRALITEADFTPRIDMCGASQPDHVLTEDSDIWLNHHHLDHPPALPKSDDLFAIMYTSGTTGPPKGVLVTHRMMRIAAEGARRVADARPGDVFFLWEPLYHIGGAQVIALPALAGISLAMTARFSASRFWQQVTESGATQIHYLGGILQMLLKQPPSQAEQQSAVRVAWGGGCPAEVFDAMKARFPFEIRECYGMTEMSSITTIADGTKGGVAGKPLPWFDLRIMDRDGQALSPGQRGEIVVSANDSGAFFKGYYKNSQATAGCLRGGWLYTGDSGSLDASGNLRFHGRLTDSLRVRGENVSAWEVEHIVATHPDIADCAIKGIEAEIGEQEILLYIQLRENAQISPFSLYNWLSPKLARHQRPRFITVVQDFPRTPSQRIQKHLLHHNPQDVWDADALR